MAPAAQHVARGAPAGAQLMRQPFPPAQSPSPTGTSGSALAASRGCVTRLRHAFLGLPDSGGPLWAATLPVPATAASVLPGLCSPILSLRCHLEGALCSLPGLFRPGHLLLPVGLKQWSQAGVDGCDVAESQPALLSLQQGEALWTARPWLLVSGGGPLPVGSCLCLSGLAQLRRGLLCFVVQVDAFEVSGFEEGKTPGGLQGGGQQEDVELGLDVQGVVAEEDAVLQQREQGAETVRQDLASSTCSRQSWHLPGVMGAHEAAHEAAHAAHEAE